VSEHQVSMNEVKSNPGEHSSAEMISELMGLVVAVGLMFGAIVGVMINMLGAGDGVEFGTGTVSAALIGAVIGSLVCFVAIRIAESMASKSSR
jgi:hypothetical protein